MRDADVRKAVLGSLRFAHAGDSDTRIVEEMNIWSGSVRIDVAVINGELSGWEIKSDRDDLSRLPMQADIYSRVFDKVALVSGGRHVKKAMPMVPDWWTIVSAVECSGNVLLEVKREGATNPNQDPLLVAELLWKSEALTILDYHDSARGWRSKRVKLIYERLCECLPVDVLKDEVRSALKARTDWLRKV